MTARNGSVLNGEYFCNFGKKHNPAEVLRWLNSDAFRQELIGVAKRSLSHVRLRVNGKVRAESAHEDAEIPENALEGQCRVKKNRRVNSRRKI